MNDEKSKLVKIALRYLSFRPRLSQEIKKRLQKESKNDSLINEIIARLSVEKIIDDDKFIVDYISSHTSSKIYGPIMIRFKLIKIGAVPKQIDEQIKQMLPLEKQLILAKTLIEKRHLNMTDYKDKAKTARFLMSRGFPASIVYRQIDLTG